ncbi:CSL zinc finger containing protein [Euroglyphus maynei]|uniref:CSL zinc finger containing protein n=1 Tax=Euroglyphus maynei TaxID=6958 RepID=A0A1Y3BP23_EURMA|nr:CSL zinc finger containing protein [Euroglyphus maynei]
MIPKPKLLAIHVHVDDLLNGEVVASCVSCSLIIKVIYDLDEIDNMIEAKETNTTKKPLKTTEKITA